MEILEGLKTVTNNKKVLKHLDIAGLKQLPIDPITGKSFSIDPYSQFILREMRVVTEYDNYVKCRNDTESEGGYVPDEVDRDGEQYKNGEIVYVAKPYHLRNSSWDGKTRGTVTFTTAGVNLLTATDPLYSYTENLICTPYEEDDRILCVFRETGIKTNSADTGQTYNHFIEWEDLNTSGRCWMMGESY